VTTRLLQAVGVVVAALLLWWALDALFTSDEERISDAVDAARDALIEKRDGDFLAFFGDDLVYQDGRGHDQLERDLRRWRAGGLSEAHIISRDIQIDPDRVARIRLVVSAGKGLLGLVQVTVEIEAAEVEQDDWRVRSFRWWRGSAER